MLENEQSRLLKKIDVTRRRAEQIHFVKKFNEERHQKVLDEHERQHEEHREK